MVAQHQAGEAVLFIGRAAAGSKPRTGAKRVAHGQAGGADREHEVAKAPGVRRVACLGDSVTLGTGLPPEEAWPQVLAALAGTVP